MSAEEKALRNETHGQRHLNYASLLISNYKGGEPFHIYLKKYFKGQKKHGASDRRLITSLCYGYFRLGMAVSSLTDISTRMLLGYFLVEEKSSPFFAKLKPALDQKISLPLSEKVALCENRINVDVIFPFSAELSSEINVYELNLSFLIKPRLFVRVRPGKERVVRQKLATANISYEEMRESCLSFSNSEKISDVLQLNREAVIQDYNSQQIGSLFAHIPFTGKQLHVWDCCAASGGKSILAFDLLKNIELTVTDIRKSILENLKQRFSEAGIKSFNSVAADISDKKVAETIQVNPDLIIADVPCSGSGTWARTPEQLHYFSINKIENFVTLQRKIIENAVKKLDRGGFFLFITCSVFYKENEDNVEFIKNSCGLTLIESRYFKGYQMKADTLFAAIFTK